MTSTEATTTITWDQVGMLGHDTKLSWRQQAELVRQLMPRVPHLGKDDLARLVAAAAGSRTPVILTWETPFGEDRIERTTDACMIEYMTVPADEPGGMHDVNHVGRVHLYRCGFEGSVYLKDVRKAEVFGAIREYLDADEA